MQNKSKEKPRCAIEKQKKKPHSLREPKEIIVLPTMLRISL
jgi:hypothetical protein